MKNRVISCWPLARRVIGLVAFAMAATALGFWLWSQRTGGDPPPRELAAHDAAGAPAGTRGEPGGSDAPRRHAHTNHLIHETSPYLLQHAHNPVHWYAWGQEALEQARKQGKPIFLSVGYSTCYWCHVMEKESFEDEEVAAILNEQFICIKVDREERPDIDEQYMLATQLMTGRGGWPNSVWLTPDGRPWMAGTYFPKAQFMEALKALADYWANRREEVEQQADRLADAIRRTGTGGGADPVADRPITPQLLERAVTERLGTFDAANGGFGGRPKFPPHGSLAILVHEFRRSHDQALLTPITRTLDAMWLGGMHDHVGGGFHRYATDSNWLLPHFEKMLYDNAQLMRAFADGYLLTGAPRYREAVEDIFFWVRADMTSPQGAFYSAIDSGEVGKEGKTYVWHHKEVMEVLGEEDGQLFTEVYHIAKRGNFREEATGEAPGTNIIHLSQPLGDIARERGADTETFKLRMAEMREKLRARRNSWVQPHKDDKVLTSWNGLMIGSLAYAGRQLDEPRYTRAAVRAADFILDTLVDDRGRLLRTYRDGQVKSPGYLDDYVHLAHGLIELYQATGASRWLHEAQRLVEIVLTEFEDQEHGAFFFTADMHDDLLLRSKNLSGGGNVPSANGVTAQVLMELTRLTGEQRYADAAKRALDALAAVMWQNPRAADSEFLAAGQWLAFSSPPHSGASEARHDGARAEGASESLPASAADARQVAAPVTAQAFASRRRVRPGTTFHMAVVLDIDDGWHLYGSNPGADFLVPTTVTVHDHEHLSAGEAVVPEGTKKQDPVLNQLLEVYEGRIWFLLPVIVHTDATPGAATVQLIVKTQACDASRCLPPRTHTLNIPIVVDPAAPTDALRHDPVFEPLLRRGIQPTHGPP